MPLDALALALAAAVVHAMWNLLTAQAEESQVAAGVAMLLGAVALAPVVVVAGGHIGTAALPYAAVSILFELAYLGLLATAYQRAPLSVVYPVARGTAPVIVLVVSVAALGAAVPVAAAAGVVAVGAGVVLVRSGRARGAGLGLAIAACIAGYTLLDNAALGHADPLPYLELIFGPAAGAYCVIAAVVRGPHALAAELRPSVAIAGLGMVAAYGLTLAALAIAPAAPVAAVRESSVVIATGLAAVVLHERVGRARFAGAMLVVAGIAAIALGG